MKIIPLHEPNQEHLEEIIAEMKVLGAPKIKAIWDESYECWIALEGVHRIYAALELGLRPKIIKITDTSKLASELGLDWQDDDVVESAVDTAWMRETVEF